MDETKKYELAEADYISGMKYQDIADKYNVSINTVKSWKKRYAWSREGAHKNKKGCTQNKKHAKTKKEPIAQEVMEVIENNELTDKQRLFCVLYTRCFNATKAYQKAYGVDYATAASVAYRMMENDGVKKEINRLKQNRLNREMLSETDIFQKYMDIAFADMTDYAEWGQEEVVVMSMYGPVMTEDKKTGQKITLTKKISVVRFKESSEVDGTLISEIKQGKNGTSIKLADRMKALQWLSEHMNLATEKQKAEILHLKAQTQKIKSDMNGEKETPLEIIFRKASDSNERTKNDVPE